MEVKACSAQLVSSVREFSLAVQVCSCIVLKARASNGLGTEKTEPAAVLV